MTERKAFFPQFPDPRGMTARELNEYREVVRAWIAQMDEEEPADMESEAYEAWGDRHEELEDLLDEIMELLEE